MTTLQDSRASDLCVALEDSSYKITNNLMTRLWRNSVAVIFGGGMAAPRISISKPLRIRTINVPTLEDWSA